MCLRAIHDYVLANAQGGSGGSLKQEAWRGRRDGMPR